MNDIWLISDTHFCHKNILKFKDIYGNPVRSQFSDVDEMDEFMFDQWNQTVKEDDIVYHLGDLAMGGYRNSSFINRFRSLPGKKYLIVGNHDDIKWCVKNEMFKEVLMWKKFKKEGWLLTHIPADVSNLKFYTESDHILNIHGHIHNLKSPSKNHRCVCVEWTDYKPISIEEVEALNNYVTGESDV